VRKKNEPGQCILFFPPTMLGRRIVRRWVHHKTRAQRIYEAIHFSRIWIWSKHDFIISLHIALRVNLLACLLLLPLCARRKRRDPNEPTPPRKSPQLPARIHPIRCLSRLPRQIRGEKRGFSRLFSLAPDPLFPFFDSGGPVLYRCS
jgi:hypothetical protein